MALTRPEVFFSATPAEGRVTPSAITTWTPPRVLSNGETVDLDLRPPRTVYGTVSIPDPQDVPDPMRPERATNTLPIAATVQFRPVGLGDVVGAIQVATSMMPMSIANQARGATWSVLVPDGAYDVVVRPAPELLGRVPPRYERMFDVRSDSALQRFDITWPREHSRWSGVITDAMGRGLPGLTARAVDPAHDDALVSTVASTTPSGMEPPGAFTLLLSPGAPEDWTLRIWSDTSAQGWLTVDLPRQTLERLGDHGQALRIILPDDTGLPSYGASRPAGVAPGACVGCVTVSGSVEGEGPNRLPRPLRDTTVVFRAPLTLPGLPPEARVRYEARARTGADGTFTVTLLPGTYDVVLTPEQGAYGNAVRRGFRVRPDLPAQRGQVFSLAPRIPVEGRVLTARGEPVRSARVTAIPFARAYLDHPCLQDPALRVLSALAVNTEVGSAGDGSWTLDLDPGLYRMLIEPREDSGSAAVLSPPLCVASRVQGFDLTVGSPVEVHGMVRDAARAPQANAALEALVRVREGSAPGVVVRVARALTGSNGRYTMLLPGTF